VTTWPLTPSVTRRRLGRSSNLPPSLGHPRASPCDVAREHLRRARTRSIAACLRPPYTLPRTPSIGLMLNLAIEPSSYAIIVRSRARAPHPFERCEPALLVREEPPPRPTLRLLGSPRGSPRRHLEDASHRSLQPTFRYEHSYIVRFPRPRLAPWSPRP